MTTETLLAAFGGVIVLLLTLAGVLFNRWMDDLTRKIMSICATNEKGHDELWRAMRGHNHWVRRCEDGYETAGTIMEAER